MSDLWVFGYGSLMWRPGFPHVETVPARLHGAHRALCVWSVSHRGTSSKPGLVLGLDKGGSCRGVAFRVAEDKGDSVKVYLRARELITHIYREVYRPVKLEGSDDRTVNALVYVVDRRHRDYAGVLPPEVALEIVRGGHGDSGPNRDYVVNTVNHLKQLGIRDPALEWIAGKLEDDALMPQN
ncbi:MAG: gamma-glutamylcyclotransferase [Bauldia sp.]